MVAVSEAMLEMWASFVVTGDPTPPGSSVAASWDPVTPGDQRYLVIGEAECAAPSSINPLLQLYLSPTLEPDLRPVTGSHFARPGKSAAAAAITLSTQGVNEHQIELLE